MEALELLRKADKNCIGDNKAALVKTGLDQLYVPNHHPSKFNGRAHGVEKITRVQTNKQVERNADRTFSQTIKHLWKKLELFSFTFPIY